MSSIAKREQTNSGSSPANQRGQTAMQKEYGANHAPRVIVCLFEHYNLLLRRYKHAAVLDGHAVGAGLAVSEVFLVPVLAVVGQRATHNLRDGSMCLSTGEAGIQTDV